MHLLGDVEARRPVRAPRARARDEIRGRRVHDGAPSSRRGRARATMSIPFSSCDSRRGARSAGARARGPRARARRRAGSPGRRAAASASRAVRSMSGATVGHAEPRDARVRAERHPPDDERHGERAPPRSRRTTRPARASPACLRCWDARRARPATRSTSRSTTRRRARAQARRARGASTASVDRRDERSANPALAVRPLMSRLLQREHRPRHPRGARHRRAHDVLGRHEGARALLERRASSSANFTRSHCWRNAGDLGERERRS